MGPKKGRRVRKIEVPTDNVPEIELWDTAANTQQRTDEREEGKRIVGRGPETEEGRG